MINLNRIFVRNRAEEGSKDIWGDYILPLFYDQIHAEISEQGKAAVIEGSRGCGKTSLLYYLSHYSQFSPNKDINSDRLENVGLYLKADTNFLSILSGPEKKSDHWQRVFKHYFFLSVSKELLLSLHSINSTPERYTERGGLDTLSFEDLEVYINVSPNLKELQKRIKNEMIKVQLWANNVDTRECPDLFCSIEFVYQLAESLKEQLSDYLANTHFTVFIDEYENLLEYQQKVINGYLKHNKKPVLFHVAMKTNGMMTRRTIGNESLQEPDDFRTIRLDQYFKKNSFNLFAAELLFSRLHKYGGTGLPFDPNTLTEPSSLEKRNEQAYSKELLRKAKEIFPKKTVKEVAAAALEDKTPRVKRIIAEGLKGRETKLTASNFINRDYPDATLVAASVLNRKNKTPEKVYEEFQKHIQGKPSSFDGPSGWIKNNLRGCIFLVYIPFPQDPCPLYAGFDSFIKISNYNVRQLLELFHTCFKTKEKISSIDDLTFSLKQQASAAKEVAEIFLLEIKGAGKYANILRAFALTLGQTFKLAHQRLSQSEPEVSHFSFSQGEGQYEDLSIFISESVKWSVLVEDNETKKKSTGDISFDYILNPVYAAYFGITYLKVRKLDITPSDLQVIFKGDFMAREKYIRSIEKKFSLDNDDKIQPLFTLGS